MSRCIKIEGAEYLNNRGIDFTILENDFIDLVESQKDFKSRNILVPITQYPGSLSSSLAKILVQNEHIFYFPYGYPMNEIVSSSGFHLDSQLHFCKVFTENLDESKVWKHTERIGKVVTSGRLFQGNNLNLEFPSNIVIFNFHHPCHGLLPFQGGRGNLIYHLEELIQIFRLFPFFRFKLTFHPIFWQKLEEHLDIPELFKAKLALNHFLDQIPELKNVEVCHEPDWRSELGMARVIFTESPSLLYKSSKFLVGSDVYAMALGTETDIFSSSATNKTFFVVKNISEILKTLENPKYQSFSLKCKVRISAIRARAFLQNWWDFRKAMRIIEHEFELCEVH